MTDITKTILKDRIAYVSSVSKDRAIKQMGDAEVVNNVIGKLMDKDLYTSITQINDYAKAAAEKAAEEKTAEKADAVKTAEPKQNTGSHISFSGSGM